MSSVLTNIWLKTKQMSSQHYKNPSNHPSSEMDTSNQLSSVSPALLYIVNQLTVVTESNSGPEMEPVRIFATQPDR